MYMDILRTQLKKWGMDVACDSVFCFFAIQPHVADANDSFLNVKVITVS